MQPKIMRLNVAKVAKLLWVSFEGFLFFFSWTCVFCGLAASLMWFPAAPVCFSCAAPTVLLRPGVCVVCSH